MNKRALHTSPAYKFPLSKKFSSLKINPQTLLAFPYGIADKNPNLKWKTRPVLESDLDSLYSQVFGDPEAMKKYEKGIPFSRSEINQRFQQWKDIAQKQLARGAFLITDQKNNVMGYVIILESEQPGVARIAQAYDLRYASQGLSSSIVRCFLEQWGPWVRYVGNNFIDDFDITRRFHCFQGECLQKFYALVSPSNPAAWSIVDRFGFQRTHVEVDNIILNYHNPRINRKNKENFLKLLEEMEENILNYFLEETVFEKDKKYLMIDLEGRERTFKYSSQYQQVAWHFEYSIS